MAASEILWIKKLDYPKGWGIRGNSHDFRQMFYITDGTGHMQIDQKEVEVRPNSCVLIKPYEQHRLFCIEEGCLKMYDLKFTVSDPGLIRALDALPSCVQTAQEEPLHLMTKIRQEWKTARHSAGASRFEAELARVYCDEMLYLLLREQTEGASEETEQAGLIDPEQYPGIAGKIIAFLNAHYAEDFSLDHLAAGLSYNRNYLCNVFKNTTGQTIQNYVRLLRIRKATELICNSHRTLADISETVGFKDIHHFNRVYKAVTGQTPGTIRAQAQEGVYSDIVEHGEFLYRYCADAQS